MFQHQVAVWECACNVWHEGTGISGTPTAYNKRGSEGPRPDDEQKFPITPWGKSFDLKFRRDLFQYLCMIQTTICDSSHIPTTDSPPSLGCCPPLAGHLLEFHLGFTADVL